MNFATNTGFTAGDTHSEIKLSLYFKICQTSLTPCTT
jgi:hypothetical protein